MSEEETDPSYTLVPILKRSHVNRGERVVIRFFIVGAGDVEKAKLNMTYHYPELLDEDTPGGLKFRISLDKTGDGLKAVRPEDDLITEIDHFGNTMMLNSGPFMNVESWPELKKELDDYYLDQYPIKNGERTINGDPPGELFLNISENASPGDYTATLVLVYGDGNQTKMDRQEVDFHVNTKVERWEPIPTAFTILAAFIALTSLMIQANIFTTIWKLLPI